MVAILRVEQLYPFPHKAFAAELKKYPTPPTWCGAETNRRSQGAWFFINCNIYENMLEGPEAGAMPAARPRPPPPSGGPGLDLGAGQFHDGRWKSRANHQVELSLQA